MPPPMMATETRFDVPLGAVGTAGPFDRIILLLSPGIGGAATVPVADHLATVAGPRHGIATVTLAWVEPSPRTRMAGSS